MNIGLALDRKNGVESPVIGQSKSGSTSKAFNLNEQQREAGTGILAGEYDLKEAQNKWNGWGTCLKPSYESIIVAQKPYNIELYLLIEILDILNEVVEKCQLKLDVKIVEKFLKLNQAKQCVEENIVLKNAENKMFTKEDLLEVMDMLQLILTENTNLNTELLCLNFLAEICKQMNKYTIETRINLITELKILKLLVVENISKNTIAENKTKQLGMMQNVLTVEEFLKEEKLKLNYINILSVQENAILKEEKGDLHPNINQIIVARKPFKGSLVDNVLKYGVGGINIDECKVPLISNDEKDFRTIHRSGKLEGGVFNNTNCGLTKEDDVQVLKPDGRFPSNTILTYDDTDFDEVCGGFPVNDNPNGSITKKYDINNHVYGDYGQCNLWESYQDTGSACRYFYCAKSSKKDRDEGLEGFKEQKIYDGVNAGFGYRNTNNDNFGDRIANVARRNIHPTVKPTELMQYLVRLVTPKKETVLDPFMGSGSTGKAVMLENLERNANYKFVGIEMDSDYFNISEARIEWASKLELSDIKEVEDGKGGLKYLVKEKQSEKELGSLFQRMM